MTNGVRRVAVITTARSEYGIYRPLLRAIRADPKLELQLIAGASHLDPRFNTVSEISADGFELSAEVRAPLEGDGPSAISKVMGEIAIGMADALERLRPDLIVALGDRSEMQAAVAASVPFLIPVAHIAGGALTRGAIDDGFRHSITKLSHIHLPETELQGQRILRLGEERRRIHVVGSLSIDNVLAIEPLTLDAIAKRFHLDLTAPPILVTIHPESHDFTHTRSHIATVLEALTPPPAQIIFTYPGADAGGQIIIDAINSFVRRYDGMAFAVPHFGTVGYFSVMRHALAMVGNSSSGIIEAASFGLPVVNIGRRQEGRLAPPNVLHCSYHVEAIRRAVSKAIQPETHVELRGVTNPYGDGHTAERMIEVLKNVPLDATFLLKADF